MSNRERESRVVVRAVIGIQTVALLGLSFTAGQAVGPVTGWTVLTVGSGVWILYLRKVARERVHEQALTRGAVEAAQLNPMDRLT